MLGVHQGFGVKGWRKSLDRVAAFYFTALPDSYAARTGRPGNVGVIGVAVFRKKPEPVVQYSPPQARGAAEAEAPAAVQKSARLGTGHGRSEVSQVTYTEFERATRAPAEVITIHYDSYRNLLAQGVIRATVIARPNPFPGLFVPDPR